MQNSLPPSDHIRYGLEDFERDYEFLVYLQTASGASAKSVPADGHLTCRYCAKGEPEVKFTDDCHALMDAIGNRHLFAEDECDTCNHLFGDGIENDFGKWSLPYRVISCIRGKNGYATIKRPGWRIEGSAIGPQIFMDSDSDIARILEEENTLKINELPRDSHTPIAVYKAFVRMGLAMMPRSELTNFEAVIGWVKNLDHTVEIPNVCSKILHSTVPIIAQPNSVSAILLRRHTSDLNIPYMIFVLCFSNYFFQIFLPSPAHLQNQRFTSKVFPFLCGPDANRPITPETFDMSGKDKVKNQMVPIYGFGFESVEHAHTSRQEYLETAAYFIWEQNGRKPGRDLDNWLRAEKRFDKLFEPKTTNE